MRNISFGSGRRCGFRRRIVVSNTCRSPGAWINLHSLYHELYDLVIPSNTRIILCFTVIRPDAGGVFNARSLPCLGMMFLAWDN